MIERYTIKFGPAVSQKELEKALNEAIHSDEIKRLHKMKARIEMVGDFADIQKISDLLKQLAKPS